MSKCGNGTRPDSKVQNGSGANNFFGHKNIVFCRSSLEWLRKGRVLTKLAPVSSASVHGVDQIAETLARWLYCMLSGTGIKMSVETAQLPGQLSRERHKPGERLGMFGQNPADFGDFGPESWSTWGRFDESCSTSTKSWTSSTKTWAVSTDVCGGFKQTSTFSWPRASKAMVSGTFGAAPAELGAAERCN